MKWNEAVFRALGEIDPDAVPDAVAGKEGTEDDAEVPRGKTGSGRRLIPVLAAAVLLCAGIGLFAALRPESPAYEDPHDPDGPIPAVREPIPDEPRAEAETEKPTADPARNAEDGAWNRDIFRYLTPSPFDDFIPIERVLDLPPPGEPSPEPQIFAAEDPESIALPSSTVIETTDGQAVRLVFYTEDWDSEDLPLTRNLQRDLSYANFTRSYGCVLWEADWERGEARYLGVVPLLKPEEIDARLLAGDYLTPVPEELTPQFTPEALPGLVGRRVLAYLLTPASDRILMAECIFIRLEDGWGLYCVPATDLSGLDSE